MARIPNPLPYLLAIVAFIAGAASVSVTAQTAPAKGQSAPNATGEGAKLAAIAERYFQAGLELNPLRGTSVTGDAKYEDKLAIEISPAYIAKQKALLTKTQAELRELRINALSAGDRLTYDVLQAEVRDALEGMQFPDHLMPVDQYGGLPVYVAQFGSGEQLQPLKTVANYRNYLKRLLVLADWTAQAEINMREGIRRGVVKQKPLIVSALPAYKSLAEPVFEKSPFYAAIKVMPSAFSTQERAELTTAYRAAFESKLQPAMAKFTMFLEREYLPKCSDRAGIDALPTGKKWYEYLVRQYTTTSMTPTQIHALGVQEVARIRDEMDQIRRHFKFEGSIADFLRWADEDPRFRPFNTEQEILDWYQALNKKVMPKLPTLFGRSPKAPLEVRLVPEIAKATASDHYQSPSADGSRPGVFYTVVMDPKKYSTLLMTTLYLHEGQPGHHYHLALQQELTLPKFRQFGGVTAYAEGWALYAETLGYELGLYEDQHARLGHLSDELLRAVRLVTDTGLHFKGWSREQSIKYMMDMQGYSEAESVRATERYMAWPGQALAYKVGSLKIQALRDRARKQLGEKFSLREFHDTVLAEGALPLTLLEKKVDSWIAARAKQG